MKIIFISNLLTPHQIPICDEWSSMLGVDFTFIETLNIDKSTLPIGWRSNCKRDYLVTCLVYESNKDVYNRKIIQADIVILGSAPIDFVIPRLQKEGLTFIYSERIYRNVTQLLKIPYHIIKFRKLYSKYSNLYLLCASAFSAADYNRIGCFKNKAYKWGYFTSVDQNVDLELLDAKSDVVKIMWCARFLRLKHPELAIELAKRLKIKGYKFTLNMYGSGVLFNEIQSLIKKENLEDVVFLMGEMTNEMIRQAMREHEIFLFTSDYNEGWGAVANEAMSSGCAIVGSSAIGSIPFLVKDMENGCVFESMNIDSLLEKTEWLIKNPEGRLHLRKNAIISMRNLWSPLHAAKSLLYLARALKEGFDVDIKEGPCSVAGILSNNWYLKK